MGCSLQLAHTHKAKITGGEGGDKEDSVLDRTTDNTEFHRNKSCF
jgi:hypothetical protein